LRKRFEDPVAEYSATVGIQQLKMEKSLNSYVESFMKFKRKLKVNDITLIAWFRNGLHYKLLREIRSLTMENLEDFVREVNKIEKNMLLENPKLYSQEQKNYERNTAVSGGPPTCNKCKQTGHFYRECPLV
jgi:Zinc knuckle